MNLEKNIHYIMLCILVGRIVFIFSHAFQSHAQQSFPKTIENVVESIQKEPEPEAEMVIQKVQNIVDLNQDIVLLEIMYKEQKDEKILISLIEKLAKNYEFDKANSYLAEFFQRPNHQEIDANLHLYLLLHDPTVVSINDAQSIQKIVPIIDEYKVKGLLSVDDYAFYQGLIKIRNRDYKGARDTFNTISSPHYQQVITSLTQAISQYDASQAIPAYYQDGLVALSLLKNGYFSLAKKIALETALKDSKYVLPFQILAYTHFLTNNRETAAEYFLKLSEFDKVNQDLYKFLIGVSFYRSKEYQQSVLYLSQVTAPSLVSDTYRYLILNYLKIDDTKRVVETWQQLLGQSDVGSSDFYSYFYEVFYAPYLAESTYALYKENTLLADMFLERCGVVFSGSVADVCEFGNIGQYLANGSPWLPDSSELLLKLARTYNMRYLYKILGDITGTKDYYIKALSLCTDNAQKRVLQQLAQ